VLDLPLGDPSPRQEWAVMVNILGGPASGSLDERLGSVFAAHPAVKVHTYGKDPRPGRKVGHVNAVGDDLDDVAYDARAAASLFQD
jgi:5-(carboxyamino)imidazole ribonucleotide synthase